MKKFTQKEKNLQQQKQEVISNEPQSHPEQVCQPLEIQPQQSQEIEYEQPSPEHASQHNQQYDQYGHYDQYGQQMGFIEQSLNTYDKRISSQSNTQCQMQDLVKIIQKDVSKIIELTGFDRYWALVYYQNCGWKTDLVSKFVDQKLSCRKMVSYKQNHATIVKLSGTCDVCCLDEQIILANMCGDKFCQNCWKQHLEEKLKTFNTDPFPPCINSECQVRTSPFILEEISKTDPKFKKLYLRTLCRSYAMGNKSVKICKGKQKFSCDRCFKVNKLMDIIECECCSNFVCGRCGQEYHFPSQCFEGPNWRKVVEQSTNFVENFNYRICPYCKQAVERSVGCNSVLCKCKQTFCYICGEKWLPNHSQHGICYRGQQIRALIEEKKRKNENQKEYTDKLEKYKAEIEKYLSKIKKVDQVNVQEIKHELITRFKILSNELDYLQPLKKKLQIALLIGKNYVLSQYFTQNEVMKAQLANLKPLIQGSYDHFFYLLKEIIAADNGESVMTTTSAQMRKNLLEGKLYPKDVLAKGKISMLGIMKKLQKFFQG